MKRQHRLRWSDLWLVAVPVAYFLLGLLGDYANMTFVQPGLAP